MARIKSADPETIATVNVYDPEEGEQRVEIYFRVEQRPEGATLGLAVDASNSMRPNFGANLPIWLRNDEHNVMQRIVPSLCGYLRKFSSDDRVDLIYWAVGKGGGQIEPIGMIDEALEANLKVGGPKEKDWGSGTKLAPPLAYYAERFKDAKRSMVVFITDGAIEDMAEVMELSLNLGRERAAGQRGYFKFVIVGVGKEVDEDQMDVLNDLFEGSGINDPETGEELDPWDARLAAEWDYLWDLYADSPFGITLPGPLRVTDENGEEVANYAEEFPLKISFRVPAGASYVTVHLRGQTIRQPLTE